MSPLYDFKCFDCEHEFEANIKLLESVAKLYPHCPKCGGESDKKPVATRAYNIKGDNGASTRPRSR
jgi:putative FmdB family regulatory protein